MKTPQNSKGGQPLPPGAHSAAVPGTRAAESAKGAPTREPKTLDPHKFHKDARGGPEVKTPHGVRLNDNRTISER
ncbi:MAG: hypothetical protein WCF81_18370 [Roseiarcus sp.]